MSARKQQLLKQHRRHKRIALLMGLALLLVPTVLVAWWWLPLLLVLGWVVHEAWFADHLFYAPGDDYQYGFPEGTQTVAVRLAGGQLQLQGELGEADTLILQLELRSSWLGRWLDPYVRICAPKDTDRQDFERGVCGQRYLNLSGQLAALKAGQLSLNGRFCRLPLSATLHAFTNPDYRQQRLLVIAPHADDAELAAFGLYSQALDASIVTLTQGEIEAENYQQLGLDKAAAARLKGRLRSWVTPACNCRPCSTSRSRPLARANRGKAIFAPCANTIRCACRAIWMAGPVATICAPI